MKRRANIWSGLRRLSLVAAAVTVAACASPEGLDDIHDPFETTNRRTHEFNKSLDRALLKPASEVYDQITPSPVAVAIGNFSNFLDGPGDVVNNLLQLDLSAAATNTARFAMNGTVGLLGLYDAAGAAGAYAEATDFGETLSVWGVGEGAFVELPLLGASTQRDTVGIAVDALFNPFTVILPDEWKLTTTGVKSLALVGDRARFSTTVESVLYDSADSYAQSRLFYLQSRRNDLGFEPAEEDYFDPYDELYE